MQGAVIKLVNGSKRATSENGEPETSVDDNEKTFLEVLIVITQLKQHKAAEVYISVFLEYGSTIGT